MAHSQEANLVDLFTAEARKHPDAVAIIEDDSNTCSYLELAQKAANVCAYLKKIGVPTEAQVGVLMSRNADMVAALLGILKHGAAYVPIDPDDPPQRQLTIIEKSACKIIIAHRRQIQTLHSTLNDHTAQPELTLIDIDHIPATDDDPFSPASPGGNHLAYILFTSGSTGVPKGVEIEHRSLMNLLQASRNLLGFTRQDCMLAATTIGFDISVVELFLPLICGGKMLVRSRLCWLEPKQLSRDVREHHVSFIQTGPSTWSVLLSECPDFPVVKTVVSTAEAISVDQASVLANYGENVWNLYGPTETTVWSLGYRITKDTLANRQHSAISVAIGHPLINTSVLILDASGHRVPDGHEGELYIGGIGLARGYQGDAALTREKFVFIDNERYYRTGDLAAWSEDGNLLYLGRNDNQMKIRGVRIDPGEVESAIRSHPHVQQVTATWYVNPAGSRSIVAAVVPTHGLKVSARDLRDWLEPQLPSQMIPSRFTFCNSLPMSPSGKVDRSAIRNMDAEEIQHSNTSRNAHTATEKILIRIWQRILQTDGVSPDDHFFTIGGDSLAAVKVLTHVEAETGILLPVDTIFQHPVLSDFAERIDRINKKSNRPPPFKRLYSHTAQQLNRIRKKKLPTRSAPTATVNHFAQPLPPTTDPEEILRRQQMFTEPWVGKRIAPTALVVTLNESGKKPGLFWCMQGYRELTQLAGFLGLDQPVHGMRSGFKIIHYACNKSIQILAALYADEIMRIQPTGGLYIGGNCQGGAIMRAVADELRKHGRNIRETFLMEQHEFPRYEEKTVLIYGRESHLNPYLKPNVNTDAMLHEAFPAGYRIALISGAHGEYFESPNIESLSEIIQSVLSGKAIPTAYAQAAHMN